MNRSAALEAAIARALEAFPEVHTAYLYGSAAAGRLRDDSDIDVAVAADGLLSPEARVEIYEALERATGRRVDLRDLSTLHGLILGQVLTKGRALLRRRPDYLYRRMKEVVEFNQDMLPIIQAARLRGLADFSRGG